MKKVHMGIGTAISLCALVAFGIAVAPALAKHPTNSPDRLISMKQQFCGSIRRFVTQRNVPLDAELQDILKRSASYCGYEWTQSSSSSSRRSSASSSARSCPAQNTDQLQPGCRRECSMANGCPVCDVVCTQQACANECPQRDCGMAPTWNGPMHCVRSTSGNYCVWSATCSAN